MLHLTEDCKVVEALTPAADAAGRAGDWVSLKTSGRCFIVFHCDQGNAATIAVTVQQATDVAGTSAKAITATVPIWANEDCATSDTLVAQTAAVSFTTSAAVKHKQVIFMIDPSTLDIVNGFDCIKVLTGASNAANITSAQYYLTDIRYHEDVPPAAITD